MGRLQPRRQGPLGGLVPVLRQPY
ncbi:hypothetical protein, partial [Mycobacterium kyorinense]